MAHPIPLAGRPAVTLPIARGGIFGPSPGLREIAAAGPLHRLRFPVDGRLGWLVTSHALARDVLADERFVKVLPSTHDVIAQPRPATTALENLVRVASDAERRAFVRLSAGTPLESNSPEHDELRTRLAPYFTVRHVGSLRNDIREVVESICDDIEAAPRPVDLVGTFAVRVPLHTVSRLLGLSPEARELIYSDRSDRIPSVEGLLARADDLLLPSLHEPLADDEGLIRRLATTGAFEDRELVAMAMALGLGGFGTSHRMIASTLFVLLCDPTRWERLRVERSLLPNAIEEIFRYTTIDPQDAHIRAPEVDVDLGEATVRAGEWVYVSLPAANWDPDVFENPESFDLTRDASQQMVFGFGRRACLGQNVIRLELRELLDVLLDRFPTLRLAVSVDEVPLTPEDALVFGPLRLEATW